MGDVPVTRSDNATDTPARISPEQLALRVEHGESRGGVLVGEGGTPTRPSMLMLGYASSREPLPFALG